MGAVDAFVSVNFIDKHEVRTAVCSDADPEKPPESCRRESLVEHLGRREEDIGRRREHSPARKADLVGFYPLNTPSIRTDKMFEITLNITLQPRHVFTASRATDERALIRDTTRNRKPTP